MLYNNHNIDLVVNGESLDLTGEFNITINVTMFDPSQLTSTQSEYSYEATIPATPKNNRIFDYANCLDKSNRFHQRWKAQLYADEQVIFDGTLIINSYKDNEYTVNLVSPKVYSLEDIFGNAVLTDIPWYLYGENGAQFVESGESFNGVETINQMNSTVNPEVAFPLISYGVFQKDPYFSDDVANDYTSKYKLDKWNKWYVESFYPSLNMLATMKKAFNWKGYNVGGDIFADETLKSLYMSTNLADEQVPLYNLGNPLFGKTHISFSYQTTGSGYEQELNFPYFHVINGRAGFGNTVSGETWNLQSIRIYDLMKSGATPSSQTYMYDPNEKMIVIPADGWYKIDMDIQCRLSTASSSITAVQSVVSDDGTGDEFEDKTLEMPIGLDEITPVEIQLIRNYDDDVELIKGKWNKEYLNGDPTVESFIVSNRNYNNITSWRTCFPHEDPYASELPTKKNDLSLRNVQTQFGDNSTTSSSSTDSTGRSGRRARKTDNGDTNRGTSGERRYNSAFYGYVNKDNELMAYDPAVNPNFICGFSSFGIGQPAIIKNGHSWTKSYGEEHEAFYGLDGYNALYRLSGTSGNIEESATTFNHNEYDASPTNYITVSKSMIGSKYIPTFMTGHVSCLVWLNKNDRLEVFEIHRAYYDSAGTAVNYTTTTTVDLTVEAASPKNKAFLLNEGFNYNSPTEFDKDLRLSNFMNKETTVASYIQSILDAFNFQMVQEGKNIFINKRHNALNNDLPAIIDLDNRNNSLLAESNNINFPSSIAVQYKIDTEEWGFESTVPKAKLNDDDWEDYGDSGFTEVKISDDDYNVEKQEQSLDYSYTWYYPFTWVEVDSANTENSGNTISLSLPVISKFQYMVDGYDYDESMKHDGYSLAQRFWFKPNKTDAFVYTDSYPTEKIDIYIPENSNNDMVLNYKNENNSILRKYFNCLMNVSTNKIQLETYLTIEEYNLIRNGAKVKFDETVYIPVDIQYNPIGDSPTILTMIKQ